MALIPDTAVLRFHEITPAAMRVYSFYCLKRNKESKGWYCPDDKTSQAMSMSRSRVSEARRELIDLGWIHCSTTYFVIPLMGFPAVEISTEWVLIAKQNRDSDNQKARKKSKAPLVVENSTELEENDSLSVPSMQNGPDLLADPTILVENSTVEKPTSVENSTPLVENSTAHPNIYTSPLIPAHKDMSIPPKQERFGEAIKEVFAYWQERMNHPRSKLDKKRRANIEGRLKDGRTVEEIKAAIDGNRCSLWHQGQNDRNTVFDDIELICRNDVNLERFIGLAPRTVKSNGHSNGVNAAPKCQSCGGHKVIPTRTASGTTRFVDCPLCSPQAPETDNPSQEIHR